MSHFRSECEHGVVVDQCRCPGPAKRVEIVECPDFCVKKTEESEDATEGKS